MAKLFRKLAAIFIGWYFLLTNRNNQIAKERLKICAVCKLRKGLKCSVCGCVLIAMARLTGPFDEGCSDTPKRWEPIKNPVSKIPDFKFTPPPPRPVK